MSDSVLANEEAALNHYLTLLQSNSDSVPKQELERLLGQYQKVVKNLARLIRISDKNEHRLQSISTELEVEKKKMEGIADQLSRYLPKQIYESIFSGAQSIEIKTTRKLLTVFFSDIQGFTLTSSRLQPEVLTHYINQYFSELSAIAEKHGATIDKFIGDAMMIFFGDPITRGGPEDALACVTMAVEMQACLAKLNAKWQQEGLQYPFITRMGINSGWCNVGNFGSAERMAYTIIGGEVNLAARIESNCPPGGVLISGETYAFVKDHVDVEEKESIAFKGINRPVQLFSVKRLRTNDAATEPPVELKLPGRDPLSVEVSELNLPDRLAFIQNLKEAISKLERYSND